MIAHMTTAIGTDKKPSGACIWGGVGIGVVPRAIAANIESSSAVRPAMVVGQGHCCNAMQ